jgi:hypothetical protein
MFENADLIHRYSRDDALRDGVLSDVSATAREAGFRWPVALTRTVWERCVRVPPGRRLDTGSWDDHPLAFPVRGSTTERR